MKKMDGRAFGNMHRMEEKRGYEQSEEDMKRIEE